MNPDSLKISVVTVCYNAVDTLEETMLSVLNQTYPNVEYIVIDGGSTDGTVDIIKKYADRLAYWVSEPDKGIYDAMNKGIAAATGDYINFMNAGDRFYDENTLSKCADFLANENNTDILYGSTILKSHLNIKEYYPHPFFNSNKRIRPMGICHQSILVRTSLAKKYKFDLSFKIAADYNMIMQLYKLHYQFKEIHLFISVFDTTGISSTLVDKKYLEEVRICECHRTPYVLLKYYLLPIYTRLILAIKSI